MGTIGRRAAAGHGRWADRGNSNGSLQDHRYAQHRRFLQHRDPGDQSLGPLGMRALRRPKRRDLLLISALALLFVIGLQSLAEAAEKVYRIGVLAPEGMRAIESCKER